MDSPLETTPDDDDLGQQLVYWDEVQKFSERVARQQELDEAFIASASASDFEVRT